MVSIIIKRKFIFLTILESKEGGLSSHKGMLQEQTMNGLLEYGNMMRALFVGY